MESSSSCWRGDEHIVIANTEEEALDIWKNTVYSSEYQEKILIQKYNIWKNEHSRYGMSHKDDDEDKEKYKKFQKGQFPEYNKYYNDKYTPPSREKQYINH